MATSTTLVPDLRLRLLERANARTSDAQFALRRFRVSVLASKASRSPSTNGCTAQTVNVTPKFTVNANFIFAKMAAGCSWGHNGYGCFSCFSCFCRFCSFCLTYNPAELHSSALQQCDSKASWLLIWLCCGHFHCRLADFYDRCNIITRQWLIFMAPCDGSKALTIYVFH